MARKVVTVVGIDVYVIVILNANKSEEEAMVAVVDVSRDCAQLDLDSFSNDSSPESPE